jgi:hypothetical protein
VLFLSITKITFAFILGYSEIQFIPAGYEGNKKVYEDRRHERPIASSTKKNKIHPDTENRLFMLETKVVLGSEWPLARNQCDITLKISIWHNPK